VTIVSELEQNWQQIVDYSLELIELAKQGDWDQVSQKESRRTLLLKSYLQQARGQVPVEELQQKIQLILSYEQQTMALANEDRKVIAGYMKNLNQAKRASNAYLENQ
jgi:thiamine biosynthesis lipoprotein ApbE